MWYFLAGTFYFTYAPFGKTGDRWYRTRGLRLEENKSSIVSCDYSSTYHPWKYRLVSNNNKLTFGLIPMPVLRLKVCMCSFKTVFEGYVNLRVDGAKIVAIEKSSGIDDSHKQKQLFQKWCSSEPLSGMHSTGILSTYFLPFFCRYVCSRREIRHLWLRFPPFFFIAKGVLGGSFNSNHWFCTQYSPLSLCDLWLWPF